MVVWGIVHPCEESCSGMLEFINVCDLVRCGWAVLGDWEKNRGCGSWEHRHRGSRPCRRLSRTACGPFLPSWRKYLLQPNLYNRVQTCLLLMPSYSLASNKSLSFYHLSATPVYSEDERNDSPCVSFLLPLYLEMSKRVKSWLGRLPAGRTCSGCGPGWCSFFVLIKLQLDFM